MDEFQKLVRDPILSQKLILCAREAIVKWEGWLDREKPILSETEVDLHEMSIRYAKGVIKVWRIWLTRQPQTNDKAIVTTAR